MRLCHGKRVALGRAHRVQFAFSTTNERIHDEQQEAQGNVKENDIMFRPDRARAHPGMEDRGDRIGREVKWGQAPLALAFLSLVSMLSITFLISTALRHIVAKLPR